MALDKAALLAALDTDPAYDTDVVAGASGNVHALLHAPDGGLAKRFKPISIADFQGAVAVEYAGLSPALRGQIDSYLASQAGDVPVHKPGVQAWVNANLPDSKAAIIALAQQDGRPVDAFLTHEDDTGASKADVLEALVQITKCQMHPATQATLQAAKQVKRDAGVARRAAIAAAWDGSIRQEVKESVGLNLPNTSVGNIEKLRLWERKEKLLLFRESVAATPL